jgi:hypothetical protein
MWVYYILFEYYNLNYSSPHTLFGCLIEQLNSLLIV